MADDTEHEEQDGEPVNTDVSTTALIRLFRDRCDRALDPDDPTKRKHTLQNIRDVCDNILERNEENV